MLKMSGVSKMLEKYFPYNKKYKKKYNLNFLLQIYNDINDGFHFVEENKNNFYNISVENDFQNPSDFNLIPEPIKENFKYMYLYKKNMVEVGNQSKNITTTQCCVSEPGSDFYPSRNPDPNCSHP